MKLKRINSGKDLRNLFLKLKYLRFMPGLRPVSFRLIWNMKLSPGLKSRPVCRQAETDLAASIFARNYPRSFTVENSRSPETCWPFCPQSDETVIEMQAGRKGEFTYEVYSPFSEEEIIFLDRKVQTGCWTAILRRRKSQGLKRMFVRFEENTKSKVISLKPAMGQLTHPDVGPG